MAPTTDLELIGRARSGDAGAREALVRRHLSSMLATAGRILGPHHAPQAVDAVRDAFAWAFDSQAEHDGTEPLTRWLYRTTVRAAVARHPAPAHEAAIDGWLPRFDADGHRTDVRSTWVPPAEGLDRPAAARVRRLVATLPDELRLVLILRDVEGLPADEVAALLRASPVTVAHRLHRARMALRHLLERHLGE